MLKFANDNYPNISTEWKVIVVNSHSDDLEIRKVRQFIKTNSNFDLVHSNIKGSLQDALWCGWIGRDSFEPDVVHIMESDSVPSSGALEKMIDVYLKEEKAGSISPMYNWEGKSCYPTHNHWFTDKIYKEDPINGTIRTPGGAGVPFLFSLWRPQLLQYINMKEFKPLVHLDRDFGGFVFKKGWHHLRLSDVWVGHYNKGKNSR